MLSQILLAYSDPIRQSRRHRATSRVFLAYRPCLRCAGAPRRPARPSLLSLARCPHVPPTLPRWVRWSLPLSTASGTRLPRITSESPPTAPSLPAIPDGGPFRGCIVRVLLRPVRLPGPPGWLRRGVLPRLLRYRVTPAFGTGRRRAVLGVRLDGRTGNLPSSGLAPD